MNSVLNKIAKAEASKGGNYPGFGKYRFKVKTIRVKEGGFKGDSVITELEVVTAEATHPDKHPSKVGVAVDYVENLSDPKKGGGGRFKSFLMALVGAEEHEFANPASLAKFVNEKQAGVGLLVDCTVYPKKIGGKDGKPEIEISGFKWSHVELTDEQLAVIDAERAALKLKPVLETLQSA